MPNLNYALNRVVLCSSAEGKRDRTNQLRALDAIVFEI